MDISAEIELHDGAYYDVFVQREGNRSNITRFRAWEDIRKAELSPSKKYLMVWHKPNQGPRLVITIYDIEGGKTVADRSPGFGGDLSWTQDDKLVHVWGCGTNCYTLKVYTHELKDVEIPDLEIGDIGGGYKLSPDAAFVFFFAMDGFEYSILDLSEMKVRMHRKVENHGRILDAGFIETGGVMIYGEAEGRAFEEKVDYRHWSAK